MQNQLRIKTFCYGVLIWGLLSALKRIILIGLLNHRQMNQAFSAFKFEFGFTIVNLNAVPAVLLSLSSSAVELAQNWIIALA